MKWINDIIIMIQSMIIAFCSGLCDDTIPRRCGSTKSHVSVHAAPWCTERNPVGRITHSARNEQWLAQWLRYTFCKHPPTSSRILPEICIACVHFCDLKFLWKWYRCGDRDEHRSKWSVCILVSLSPSAGGDGPPHGPRVRRSVARPAAWRLSRTRGGHSEGRPAAGRPAAGRPASGRPAAGRRREVQLRDRAH